MLEFKNQRQTESFSKKFFQFRLECVTLPISSLKIIRRTRNIICKKCKAAFLSCTNMVILIYITLYIVLYIMLYPQCSANNGSPNQIIIENIGSKVILFNYTVGVYKNSLNLLKILVYKLIHKITAMSYTYIYRTCSIANVDY